MISQAKVVALCETFLKDTENFLIDVKVSSSNRILIHIENDKHVSIQDCISLSRFVERSLDRETEDFELEVSSPGIDQPFKHLRQYQKNLGRPVEVKMADGTILKGILEQADEQSISLRAEEKKNKKIKADTTAGKEIQTLSLPEVKETKLKLIF